MGLWTLDQLDAADVGLIFTLDDEIFKAAKKLGIEVTMEDPNSRDYISSDLFFSIHYPKILKQLVLNKYLKTYNLHPGFLPWGRGYYPISWAL
jgi:methionyl-tRNA formyltransferase